MHILHTNELYVSSFRNNNNESVWVVLFSSVTILISAFSSEYFQRPVVLHLSLLSPSMVISDRYRLSRQHRVLDKRLLGSTGEQGAVAPFGMGGLSLACVLLSSFI